MTDETKDNIIIGPWSGHNKVNSEDAENWVKKKYDRALEKNTTQLEMQSKILKVDSITENIMVQLIHTLSEQGYEIGKSDFILDIGFLSEVVKSAMFRQENLPHIIQGLVDSLMVPDKTENHDGIDMHYSKFDSGLLKELVEMAEAISEEQTDVEFLPDTELETDPEKISKWKDEKEKGSLHNMRTEKIHGKDDEDNEGKEF